MFYVIFEKAKCVFVLHIQELAYVFTIDEQFQ